MNIVRGTAPAVVSVLTLAGRRQSVGTIPQESAPISEHAAVEDRNRWPGSAMEEKYGTTNWLAKEEMGL